jgi:hypothetical protein
MMVVVAMMSLFGDESKVECGSRDEFGEAT